MSAEDAADALAEAGAVVGGGAAFGATIWFMGALVLRDVLKREIDPLDEAQRGAALGGAAGILLLLGRGLH